MGQLQLDEWQLILYARILNAIKMQKQTNQKPQNIRKFSVHAFSLKSTAEANLHWHMIKSLLSNQAMGEEIFFNPKKQS